jgi:hypothetical protein
MIDYWVFGKGVMGNLRFAPPTEGLLADENVVWARKQGIGFWIPFFAIWVLVGGVLLMSFSFGFGGTTLGVVSIIPVLVGWFFLGRAFVNAVRTKFFLTNKRIIQTRGKTIFKEMPLSRFGNRPLKQFLEIKRDYTHNGEARYVIRIFDPISAETVIDCKDLDRDSVEAFEKIGKEVRCRYCDTKNSALNARCTYCGANL